MIDSDADVDDDEVADVEVDDDEAVMINSDLHAAGRFESDLELERKPKRRRGKSEKIEKIEDVSCDPDANGALTIVVHLITNTAAGDQLTRSRKSLSIKIEDSAVYIENVDPSNARNNIRRPYITARNVHSLLVNHFGQSAADTLSKIAESYDPYLSTKLKINSNAKHLVRIRL